MFENLFGAELPLAVRFLIAFVVVLVLIVVTAWVIRRFGGTRLATGTSRGRQPRLAVIDLAVIDNRRRLLLIRRDNVEHLLMIGGPSDIVVEHNIVRALPVTAQREAALPRSAPESSRMPEVATRAAADSPPPWPAADSASGRASPPPDDGFFPPVQPEPVMRTQRAAETRPRPVAEPPRQPPGSDSPPVRPAAAPSPTRPAAEAPSATDPRPAGGEDVNLADMAQRLEAALRRPVAPGDLRGAESAPPARPATPEPPLRAEPSLRSEPPLRPEPSMRPEPPHRPESSMRHEPPLRSEGPLRSEPTLRPEPALRPVSLQGASSTEPQRAQAASEARQPQSEPKAAPAEPKPTSKTVLDSLEQEMASLLGRSASGKE